MIEAVQMVEICLMNEGVSPAGQEKQKKMKEITPLAAQEAKTQLPEIYSHRVHKDTKYEESSGADHGESYRPRGHEDTDVLGYSVEHARRPSLPTAMLVFRGNNANARHSVDNRIYLPVCANSEKDGGHVPQAPQSAEEGEKNEER